MSAEDPIPTYYPDDCPVVRALKEHHPDADGVRVSRDFTVIVRDAVATRWENSEPLKAALVMWERTGEFEPGCYELISMPRI